MQIKRIYEKPIVNDGVSKEKAHLDLWLKDIAPSTELRKWFGHTPSKWEEFKKKYTKELGEEAELIRQLKDLEKRHKQVTLLYGARDTEHNEAIVLKEFLEKK